MSDFLWHLLSAALGFAAGFLACALFTVNRVLDSVFEDTKL